MIWENLYSKTQSKRHEGKSKVVSKITERVKSKKGS
jgi:hypothetical protein